jgi:hypothetical protein
MMNGQILEYESSIFANPHQMSIINSNNQIDPHQRIFSNDRS